MKQEFRLLHNKMLQDLRTTMELELDERQKAESGYIIAKGYWDKLKEIIKTRGLNNEKEEIDFFRNVKPRFTCHIEYMILLNAALLNVPSDTQDVINYWTREMNRVKDFYNKHIDFIVYYGRKDWHFNSTYFLKKSNKSGNTKPDHPYDADPEYFTSHDPLISSYLAYTMYSKYARKRLWALTRLKNANNGTKVIRLSGLDKMKNCSNG